MNSQVLSLLLVLTCCFPAIGCGNPTQEFESFATRAKSEIEADDNLKKMCTSLDFNVKEEGGRYMARIWIKLSPTADGSPAERAEAASRCYWEYWYESGSWKYKSGTFKRSNPPFEKQKSLEKILTP